MNFINMPKQVKNIIKTLENAGFEAYIVGGCVRDCIIGKKPKDWDITTSALPEQTKSIFNHTYDTGIKHGTITVVMDKTNFEITTYRIDGSYKDFRRPEEVVFTKKIDEDLSRRDFTMNAIAYNEKQGFCDPFGGMRDIDLKIIRGVGNPDKRFNEDALRMLRCIRFSAQLGFEIEENTYYHLLKNVSLIKNISKERIREEFTKLLISPYPEKILLLKNSGLLDYIIPQISEKIKTNCPEIAILKNLVNINAECISFFYCAVLHQLTENEAEKIMRDLKFDIKTIKETSALVKYIKKDIEVTFYEIKKVLSEMGEDFYRKLTIMRKMIFFYDKSHTDKIKNTENILSEIIQRGDCYSLKQLDINGNILKNIGITGKNIGFVLNVCLDKVLKDPSLNYSDKLIKIVKELNF